MPVAYLDVPPGIQISGRRKLVKGIYDALHAAYPFPDDVRLFLREWPVGSFSQNGSLDSELSRPVFTMHVPPDLGADAKRTMMKGINAAVADAYHLSSVIVFMHEHPLDVVSVDGEMLSDPGTAPGHIPSGGGAAASH